MASAQNINDPKYGLGCIPEENGVVTFTRSFPTGMATGSVAYETLLTWAKGYFVKPNVTLAKSAGEDADALSFSFVVSQDIVFRSTALVVDKSQMNYLLKVSVTDVGATLSFSQISYVYEEEREGEGLRLTAEEWITDSRSTNRKRTKFLKVPYKFRVGTIDTVDKISTAAEELFR